MMEQVTGLKQAASNGASSSLSNQNVETTSSPSSIAIFRTSSLGTPDGFSHASKTPIIRPRYRNLPWGTRALNHFADRLAAAVRLAGNAVCVGLDPRWDNLPEPLRSSGRTSIAAIADAYVNFCHGVIDVIASVVPIVKVQAAFFEELGPSGMAAMADVILYAEACSLLVIVDGKRNDIGSTAAAYARGYLGREGSMWHADALTVSPYLGDDSLAPFVQIANERGAGIFVLVKTSNPGGAFLQDVVCESEAIFRRVAAHVEQLAAAHVGECGYGAVGAVVG